MASRMNAAGKAFKAFHDNLTVMKENVPTLMENFEILETILRKPESQEKKRELVEFYINVETILHSCIHGENGEVLKSTAYLEGESGYQEAVRKCESDWNNRISDYMNKLRSLSLDELEAKFLDNYLNKAAPVGDLSIAQGGEYPAESLSNSSGGSRFDSSLVRFLSRAECKACLKNVDQFILELIGLKDSSPPFKCRSCADLLIAVKFFPKKLRRHFKMFCRRRFRKMVKTWILNPTMFQTANEGQETQQVDDQKVVDEGQETQQGDDQEVADEEQEEQEVSEVDHNTNSNNDSAFEVRKTEFFEEKKVEIK